MFTIKIPRFTRLIFLSALIVVLLSGSIRASQEAPGPTTGITLADIKVSFKLDPRVARALYMGEQWAPAATYYSIRAGELITMKARAQGLDPHGNQIDVAPTWKTGDPAMIVISPGQGPKVTLTILREGEGEVIVASGGISKKLSARAWYHGKIMYVKITQ